MNESDETFDPNAAPTSQRRVDGWVSMGVARAHGIRGEFKIVLYHRDSTYEWLGRVVRLRAPGDDAADGLREARVVTARRVAGAVLIRLEGVMDRTAADALDGMEVLVERTSLPPLADDEAYVDDLVGMIVCCGAEPVGAVRAILTYPASTCALVALDRGGEVELPLSEPYVTEVDLKQRKLWVAHLEDFEVARPRRTRKS